VLAIGIVYTFTCWKLESDVIKFLSKG